MRITHLTGLLLTLVICSACTHIPRIDDYALNGRPFSSEERQEFETHLLTDQENFKSLRMLSRCILSYSGDRYEFRYAFVARHSGELRIEQFPMNGFYSLSALASDTRRTTVVFQGEKRALVTEAGKGGLQEVFGVAVPLRESDIGFLLSGIIPSRLLQGGQVTIKAEDDGVILYRAGDGLFARFSDDFRLLELHLFDAQTLKEQLEIKYQYDQQTLPRVFSIRFPGESAQLECLASQRGRDAAVKDDVFTLTVPADFSVERS